MRTSAGNRFSNGNQVRRQLRGILQDKLKPYVTALFFRTAGVERLCPSGGATCAPAAFNASPVVPAGLFYLALRRPLGARRQPPRTSRRHLIWLRDESVGG
jgi:hypothetical protein